ncbi:MAG: hypothetical protein QXX55_02015 [Candidatus Pacearchaeota archaeon]
MFEGLFLQYGTFYGGSIGNLLSYWEQAGFFSYLLPFLLIFALVFGILNKTKFFGDRTINGILALVVGLLALQFNFVPVFFSEIFPRVGIGLSVILALLILAGLFFDPDNKHINWFLLGFAIIVFFVVLFQTFSWVGWSPRFWLYDLVYNWPGVLSIVIFLVIIGIIISAGKETQKELPNINPIWARS